MADLETTLREAARASGMSMKRIADEAGLHYATVHGFLASNRTMTLQTASRLCELLGLALSPNPKAKSTRRKGQTGRRR